MTEKEVKGVSNININNRNEHLQSNKGKYNGLKGPLDVIVGKHYDLYTNPLNTEQHSDILRYTFGLKNDYSRDIIEKYGYDVENLKHYVYSNVKPSYKVNDYDGFSDYISYIWDTYGREESYAGHLMGLLGVRELAEDLAYDIVPDFRGKTAMDVINEIMQYTDPKYALIDDSVGVVRNIDVAMAINGAVTTNINNYTGKETKLGLITNRMYASTLLTAARFNSIRRTKYITPELETLYGNNLHNVYNLSSLFRINDETGRIAEPDSWKYINDMPSGNIFNHMLENIPDFKLPESGYNWESDPNYGVNNKYFGVSNADEYGEHHIPEYNDWTIKNDDKQIGVNGPDSFRVYSEGPEKGQGGWALNEQETFREFGSSAIDELDNESLLSKTNRFLSERRARTIISRFHDKDNVENNLTQSAVYRNFGVSHGRNLLTKSAYETGQASSHPSGYSNPYCRVWTNHHQYSKMKHLIRPFIDDEKFSTIGDIQKNWGIFRTEKASERLSKYGVLNKNGMVNITPTSGDDAVDIKNCMFSIENLAWKDVITSEKGKYRYNKRLQKKDDTEKNVYDWEIDNENVLSEEQRGPNGGRIMWFPPYDITFQETASAKWSENEFIGRGEPVYTYVNSSRSGTLEFTLLVDHPSILNYWMMDKKNNATDADEQTLLRFFAGCEPLDPSENAIENILLEGYTGKTIDPKEVNREKDIIFYTFFPNNFSGVDYQNDPETAMKYLFGGYNNFHPTVNMCGEESDGTCSQEYFLGYEMGVNPISVSDFSYIESDRGESWYLDKIYTLRDAENKFETLTGFTESNVTITKDDIISCDIKNYEGLKDFCKGISDGNAISESRIEELNVESVDLYDKQGELNNKIGELETDIEEIEEGTSAYYTLLWEIKKLKSELESIDLMLLNKEKDIKNLENSIESSENEIEDISERIENVKQIFEQNINGEYNKTNPLYIYYNFKSKIVTDEDGNQHEITTFEDGDGAEICNSAAEAFAKYSVNNAKTYTTNSETDKPYAFLNEKEKNICKTKYGKSSNDEKYWVCDSTSSSDIVFMEFDNKRKFLKSGFMFGKSNDNDEPKYYVNYGGETYVFKNEKGVDAEETAMNFINENHLIPEFETEQDFYSSGELYGRIGVNYYSYDFVEVSKEQAETEIINKLNNEGGDDYVVGKYYENHKFGCLEDFGHDENYGVIQFFFTGKLQESGEMYETIQDFIAAHDIQKESENTGNTINVVHITSGVTKYVSKELTGKTAEVQGIIDWDLNERTWNYPVDGDKSKEILLPKNYYDTQSFGLNSTYEVVKKEMGDADVTFSFGEVFAALKGEKERDYVIACERAMLKKVLKLEGAELEQKVQEAKERIEYLMMVLNPKEGLKDYKVNSVKTLGTASSHGTQEKNKGLSNNREKSIQNFLKTFPLFKSVDVSSESFDPDGKSSNVIIKVSSEGSDDISDISAKKGRHSRVSIIVGNKDLTSAEIEANNEQVKKDKEELTTKRRNRRYDNERLFFEMLKENDNIAYKRLVDKVKYFSPAFHSITPEGFNARLTFLHQCTRQGPTATASDVESGTTAANLAFGRAPYCVLRLGDFLNTKIVITSVNITYPDSMWDLNPEGIGVQFMMAKVSMQIHILGGSDISAPIKRLQNAVSFNYYANTSLYDNRSDNAEYNSSSKSIETTREWFPHMEGGKSLV